MAREGLAIAGAAVGFMIGGPVGMQIGFMAGSMAGGLLFPETIPGPSLGEAPVQTSRDGIPIPRGWGLFHVGGPNVIWKGEIQEVTTTTSQGKGGGAEVEQTRRYLSFAVGICEGPVYRIRRIWENNRLVYDARNADGTVYTVEDMQDVDAAGITTSGWGGLFDRALKLHDAESFAQAMTFYNGSETQEPDPDIEAVEGVGNTPYFRGLSYFVLSNYDITDYGSMIPQYRVEILGGATGPVTSRPYPAEVIDGYTGSATPTDAMKQLAPADYYAATVTPLGGYIRTALLYYTAPPEGYSATVTPQGGYTRTALIEHTAQPEGYEATVTALGGYIRAALITYTCPPEGYVATVNPQGGYLA